VRERTHLKNLFAFRLKAATVSVGVFLAYVCCLNQFGVAAQLPPSRGKMLLQKAITHADWFNWVDAASEFQEAEKEFESEHDRRNATYAKIGFLRATMEDNSLATVRDELQQISSTSEVQGDPELLLFASIAKADVDGELNALDARNDWQQIEILAKAQNAKLWAIRAPGERSFSEFLLGNISKGRILVATALAATQKTQDVAGQIRYLTAIGAALHISDQDDQAFEYLTKATDLVRAHPEAGYSFVTNEYMLETLVGLKRYQEAENLGQSIIRESALRKKKVKEAQALITLATIQERTARQNQAIQTLISAEQLTSSGSFSRLYADVQFRLADIHRERGENRMAEGRLTRGLAATENTPEIWLMPARLESLAELKTADGKYPEADGLYHRAADLVEALIGSTSNSQAERSLIAANSEIFVKHFQLCADHLNNVEDAYLGLEETRGRTYLDMLRGAFAQKQMSGVAIDRTLGRLRQQLAQTTDPEARAALNNTIFNTNSSGGRRTLKTLGRAAERLKSSPSALCKPDLPLTKPCSNL
jgi:tetratricopeptide (TPR) repeat protein